VGDEIEGTDGLEKVAGVPGGFRLGRDARTVCYAHAGRQGRQYRSGGEPARTAPIAGGV